MVLTALVGMVAMNKGWARDRKGFNEAFRAFGQFWKQHPEAILYLHAEKFGGAEGINLVELLQHASVPDHAVRWVDQYAYRLGTPPEVMAAMYSAFDCWTVWLVWLSRSFISRIAASHLVLAVV